MTDDEHDNFTVGEDIILYVNRGNVRGKVIKVTKARITVEHSGGDTDVFHRRKWGHAFECRRVTAADIAREAWEADRLAWQRSCPVTKYLAVRFPYGNAYVRLDCEVTLDTLNQIVDEAHAIREWLRKRPERPR